ncbi:MAG TPA: SagB/ThcOx family dehydrogenase [Nitrospirota bacterium]|nr:SagB/ThcOx family dehydrogenase [Nitrospirota bacterium]
MKRICPSLLAIVTILFIAAVAPAGEARKAVPLPEPQMQGGRPLMQVLKDRSSGRSFSPEKLPLQVLSNLLWAAFGINRPESGHRTAPSARNWQEIDIYVATADGLYLYEPKEHLLRQVLSEDIRAMTGTQAFVREAPINLVYVADQARMSGASPEDGERYAAADTGFIAENVYLFCASERLATVVRGSVDRAGLARTMKLRPEQRIMLAQTIGYPGK